MKLKQYDYNSYQWIDLCDLGDIKDTQTFIRVCNILAKLMSQGNSKENIINQFSQSLPEIKQVIYNNPATIIIWKDGSKTVVKASGDEFNEEFGFAMAYLKKIFGERNKYLKHIKSAQRPQEKKENK